MAKMNPEVKERWVAALRSGEYKQTREHLRRDGGYCCLGVLCDLFAKENGRPWRGISLSDAADGLCAISEKDPEIPGGKVLIWAGLDPDLNVRIAKQSRPLYWHNDGGRTFAEIADAIEAQL